MVTEGALQGIGSIPLGESGFTLNSINANSSLVSQLGKNLVNNATSAVINNAIQGGNGKGLEKSLTTAIASAFVDAVAAKGANAIGDLASPTFNANGELVPPVINELAQQVAHMVVGCVAGAVSQVTPLVNRNSGPFRVNTLAIYTSIICCTLTLKPIYINRQ